jgi:hypothetical protein
MDANKRDDFRNVLFSDPEFTEVYNRMSKIYPTKPKDNIIEKKEEVEEIENIKFKNLKEIEKLEYEKLSPIEKFEKLRKFVIYERNNNQEKLNQMKEAISSKWFYLLGDDKIATFLYYDFAEAKLPKLYELIESHNHPAMKIVNKKYKGNWIN